MGNSKNILFCSDTQSPFQHSKTVSFFKRVAKEYHCDVICHVGDEIDARHLSKFCKDPNDPLTASGELKEAREFIKELGDTFPKMRLCNSNHGNRLRLRASEAGILTEMLRPMKDILCAPRGWQWADEWWLFGNRVLMIHGDQLKGGGYEAGIRYAIRRQCNVVHGHLSSKGGVNIHSIDRPEGHKHVFAMNCGGMVDDRSWGMAWSRQLVDKTTLGCGVLIDAKTPIFVPYSS